MICENDLDSYDKYIESCLNIEKEIRIYSNFDKKLDFYYEDTKDPQNKGIYNINSGDLLSVSTGIYSFYSYQYDVSFIIEVNELSEDFNVDLNILEKNLLRKRYALIGLLGMSFLLFSSAAQ